LQDHRLVTEEQDKIALSQQTLPQVTPSAGNDDTNTSEVSEPVPEVTETPEISETIPEVIEPSPETAQPSPTPPPDSPIEPREKRKTAFPKSLEKGFVLGEKYEKFSKDSDPFK
jgi:hypothetical protein